MKFSFLIILFISVNVSAQQVDIVLIGVSHNYSNYPRQELSAIYGKIRKFAPTAFFGEFLSKEDERLVMDYWCKQDNIRRVNMLRRNREIAVDLLPKTIDSLKQLSQQRPDDYQIKADLAHAYYLNQDVSNAHYQFWQVVSKLRQTPDKSLENYVNKLLSPGLDTTGRSMKRLKTSEYALIAFPMMLEMKIKELLPMDCQDYDLNWQASSAAFHQKFQEFKDDTAASYADELKTLLTKRDKGFLKNAGIEKSSKNVTEWLNTDEAAAIFASGDFYFPQMYDIPQFPKQEMLSQIHWWLLRNKVMCDNVVNRSRALGLKRVLVFAGANHRRYMQDIFKTMADVTIRNINEVR
ncbi:DUF5694 domain-containing protein [Dyadobacter psychrotolerans]|uniref:TraB/GumN family protein n=1 Tax=Dyadobacter psychrotolerans TaxID=2541721 RepID=A0A4R5DGN6_9BACT|nr:DUF5694 domain-containing protein [Dyadobacter psychrotolerans]TDE09593.1 hypothetical protein E0F88_30355 [Dyadobacter psychrotolerans]